MCNKNYNVFKVYEFVCRYFLVICLYLVVALKTYVDVDIVGEIFRAIGVMICECNYLDIYGFGFFEGLWLVLIYDNWGNSMLFVYILGE